MYEAGWTHQQIADAFGVGKSTVGPMLLQLPAYRAYRNHRRAVRRAIVEHWEAGYTNPEIALLTGESAVNVAACLRDHHLPANPAPRGTRRFDRAEAWALLKAGETVGAVAKKMGVHQSSVTHALRPLYGAQYRQLLAARRLARQPSGSCARCGQPRDGTHVAYCKECHRLYMREYHRNRRCGA